MIIPLLEENFKQVSSPLSKSDFMVKKKNVKAASREYVLSTLKSQFSTTMKKKDEENKMIILKFHSVHIHKQNEEQNCI